MGKEGVEAVEEVLEDPVRFMAEKTHKMNDLLNNVVPYFRCSDEDIVKIYYFLWSINLMYYTQGDSGMQSTVLAAQSLHLPFIFDLHRLLNRM